MSRVTPAEVNAILTTTIDDTTMQIWINAASAVVTRFSPCIGGDESLLTQVELYLSAHFVALLDPTKRGPVIKVKLDVLETTYGSMAQEKDSIESTTYGKTANILANGCLTEYKDRNATVEFF